MAISTNLIDLFIIGGGINGVGIAVDAAGRGLSVILCEQNDLASATSSKSSKLIHGGLRYLEQYEFRLVREALQEREVLLKKAPHIIAPLQFIMPHNPDYKPAWLLRAGLFLYDHLAKRSVLPNSQPINFRKHPAGLLLKQTLNRGFSYYDCWVDDSRLVVLNALQAKQLGATILTRHQFLTAKRNSTFWEIEIKNTLTHEIQHVKAKALVNAAGPWVDDIIHSRLHLQSKNHISLIKGSHIIVPKLYTDDFAFILINTDKRVVFVIPYLNEYSLIGTTDIAFQGDPYTATISEDEINYLCSAVNNYFGKLITPASIVHTYAGVRPLHTDQENNPSAISRDYTLELTADNQHTPLLSVFGGKITTYRKLAEQALHELHIFFPHAKPAWTSTVPLPGGNIPNADFATYYKLLQQTYSWLPANLIHRYARNYGTLTELLLQGTQCLADLGKHYGANLYEREVQYLIQYEWAQTVEDILWRRTKLGLLLSTIDNAALTRDVT